MHQILKENKRYAIVADALYCNIVLTKEMIFQINHIKLEFVDLVEDYQDSKIILDYVAERMIRDIFYTDEKKTFEELIHSRWKSLEELESFGVTTYFLSEIEQKDASLRDYVAVHSYLLKDIQESFQFVKKNWQYYIDNLNTTRINIFLQEVESYYDQHEKNILCGCTNMTHYVVKKLGLEGLFTYYDQNWQKEQAMMQENAEEYGYEVGIRPEELSVSEYAFLNYTMNLIKKLFQEDIIDKETILPESTTKSKEKSRIIKLDFDKKEE